jgi:AAA family ATP:ADP antiporter
LRPKRLLYVLCGFFPTVLVSLTYLLQDPSTITIWGFYLVGDLKTTLMVVAFWAYATDISDSDQAKRLFGAIGAGGVIGGGAGISFATSLLETIGMNGLLLTSAGLMGLIGLIVMIVERKVEASGSFQLQARVSDQLSRSVEKQSDTSTVIEGARLVVIRTPFQ